MAYKFQLGAANLSGSITQTSGAFITAQSQLRVGNAQLTEAELETLDGITAGTAAASKALVLDANKAIGVITSLTASTITAANLIKMGNAEITEAELEQIDGITAGTATASKALVVGAVKNIGGITSLTASTITVANATTLADDGLVNANGKLALAVGTLGADATSMNIIDKIAIDDGVTKKIMFHQFTGSIGVSGSMLHESVAGTNLEIDSNALRIAASAAGDGLSGGAASALSVTPAQTTITSVLNTSLALGRNANNKIDFGTNNTIKFNTNGAERMMLDLNGNLTVEGNLTVRGSTTTVESQLVKVDSKIIELNVITGSEARTSNQGAGLFLSGSTLNNDISLLAAANGGRLKVSGSTAGFDVQLGGDYAINGTSVLNATTLGSAVVGSSLTSVGALAGGSIAAGFTKIAVANMVDVTSIDIDGATDIGEDLVSGDMIIVDNGGSGANRRANLSRIATYVGDNISTTVQTLTAASQTLSVASGQIVLANRGSAMTITLDTPANHSGKRIQIKKIGAGDVTISANGSEDIDGSSDDIILESPMAAVTIISNGSDYFIV